MKFQKILLIILVLLGSAFGGIVVTATKNNHTDKAGYFNNANTLSITLTQSDGDVDQSQVYKLYCGFSSTSTVSTMTIDMSGTGTPVGIATTSGSGNDLTFIVDVSHLTAALSGASPNGKYVDFRILKNWVLSKRVM